MQNFERPVGPAPELREQVKPSAMRGRPHPQADLEP